jgi:hypothetical protein
MAKGRGRWLHGEEQRNARLTDAMVRDLRRRYASGGVTMASLAVDFGVSQPTICNTINRLSWRHVA